MLFKRQKNKALCRHYAFSDLTLDVYVVGAAIAGDNVSLAAGNDLNVQAAYLNANNALTLAAGHDVNLTDAQDRHREAHTTETQSFSFFSTSTKRFGSVDPEWRSNASSTTINQSTSVGSLLSGDSVTVAAGNNLTATNAQLVGTNGVVIAAGNNLTLNAGQNTYDYSQGNSTSRTGLMNNGGLSVLIGNRTQNQGTTVHDVSYRGSTVGSLNGSVTLSAGNNVQITGSDVLSQTGTAIVGKNVTIDAAVGSTDITQTQKVSQAGINVGLSGGLINAAQSVYGMAQAGHDVQDGRLKALYASQAAYTANDGYNAYQAAAKEGSVSSGINLRLGIGGSSAGSTGTTHDETAYGSHIHSAGNITLAAIGGDLNIIGSQINGNNVALAAANNLNILSQVEQHTLESSNKNAGGGVGVQLGTSGIGFYAQASIGKGSAHGNGITHADSLVNATDTLTLISGNDTTIKGAQLTGNTVLANIGNNLLIQSEQDTDDYASKQMQAGGEVVIGMGGGGGASYNQTKTSGHYASVSNVSGIGAGSGGFDITVGGNTHLVGGVIASSADASKNSLTTGTLTYEDIRNESSGKASSTSLGGDSSMLSGSKYTAAKGIAGNLLGNGSDSERHSITTHSAVANGNITITDGTAQQALSGKTAEEAIAGLSRDASLDNHALARPDLDQLQANAELEQGLKGFAYQVGTHYIDEAYRVMFVEAANIYEVLRDNGGNLVRDANGKPVLGRALTDEEKLNLKPGKDGLIYVANNGIFNPPTAAEQYAYQHSTSDGPQYYIAFDQANNSLSELLVAGYQKYMDNDFWGLTNVTAEAKWAMLYYGQTGLHLDGHSRGSMTIGNAMESIAKMPGAEGALSGTTVSFFGPAYSASKADQLLSYLQDRNAIADPAQRQNMVLTLQNHMADPVGRFIGGNSPTGGTIPEGSTWLKEVINALGGQNTSHNCYGSSDADRCHQLWQNSNFSPISKPINGLIHGN